MCNAGRTPWGRALALVLLMPVALAGPLHMPSPDWRDQVLYMVMTDRFADGNPRDNDQGAGEYGPGDPQRYQGGDLRGLRQRLRYIQGLGATGVWITPPVANQWWNPPAASAGYHGYWASHFGQVDRHLGTLADLRALSRALHGRGMVLVQDIVLNHMGNHFAYPQGWNPADPAAGWQAVAPPPAQAPLHLNDPRQPAHRRAGVWHFTPDIKDYNEPEQERRWQMSGLDDLATENPVVRRLLRASYGHWIRAAGVDAFRVDTAFYVEPELFDDFLRARDPAAPGVLHVARATGRRGFHVFGEGFGIDPPGQQRQAQRIQALMQAPARLPGMLNFPLYGSLNDVLARGAPAAQLGQRISAMVALHPRLQWMPSFLDNHDVDRFLAAGSSAALRQGLLALFTLPGIPVVYYGTEQGFTEQRAAMFAAGWGSGGRDRFDAGAPHYRHIAALAALRRAHKLFSRGVPQVLRAQAGAPGVLAWRTRHGRAQALVVLNTADTPQLLDALDTGAPPGTRWQGLFGLHGRPANLVADARGRVQLVLPPRAGLVWRGAGRGAPAVAPTDVPRLDAPAAQQQGDFTVSGRAAPGARLQVVVDGDLASAVPAVADHAGRYQAGLSTAGMDDPGAAHRVVAWDAAAGRVSAAHEFRVQREWRLAAEAEDPAGDDHGPSGTYQYPTDPGWATVRPADIRRVRLFTSGGALKIELTLAGLLRTWNPPNGFDHVAFTLYLQLPGQAAGAELLPLQQAAAPAGLRWHRRLRVHGWASALHGPEGASAGSEGTPLAGAPRIEVDSAQQRITLTLPAQALGSLPSLAGLKLYATTWDYDAGYRALGPALQPYAFGGAPADAPKVMDDTAVLELR